MHIYHVFSLAAVAGLTVFATGCATDIEDTPDRANVTALKRYADDNNYVPFDLPRDDWGPGTIIAIENGAEDIKAFNDQCFRLAKGTDYREASATIPNMSYKISRDNKLEAGLAKGVVRDIDITGAYQDSRVSEVTFTSTDPKEETASQLTMDMRVEQLIQEQNEGCLRQVFAENNYVIDRVLTLGTFAFSFKDKQGRTIKLDATLAEALGIKFGNTVGLEGKSEIKSDGERMVGYRLYKYIPPDSGFIGEGEVESTRVDVEELKALKGL